MPPNRSRADGPTGDESGGLSLFAITAPGLEGLVAAELERFGVHGSVEPGGVAWTGEGRDLYAANLHLRTASRVLVRVATFRAKTFFELERHARKVPWERFLTPGRAIRWRVTCRKSRLYHEGAVVQRLRDAVQFRAGVEAAVHGTGEGGEGEGEEEQLFVVRFLHDECTVSADASGALLHRRGYRQATAKAPLRETLAAAMLLGCGWDPAFPLVDPMCGAGTIPIEAALIARKIPPGLASASRTPRRFAFQEWPAHDGRLWESVVAEARERILPHAPAPLLASDRDDGAIAATVGNAERAGVEGDLRIEARALSAIEPPEGPGWLLTNPPYGVRVGEADRVRDLYAAIGSVARRKLSGWTIALLSADRRLEGQLGLRLEEALRTSNGGIPVRLMVGQAPPA